MKSKRILLKLSGSFFGDKNAQGLDIRAIGFIADEIQAIQRAGREVALVNGGGNISRGRDYPSSFDRVAADKIGMLAGVINGSALVEILNSRGIDTRLMSSFEITGTVRQFDAFRARKLLSEKKILILAGGTGQPYFTHDTAAVQRALEIKADLLLKATDVDGVYSADPDKDKTAQKYDTLTYVEALDKGLRVMDQTAFALARENDLEIIVFKFEKGALTRILKNPKHGTRITA